MDFLSTLFEKNGNGKLRPSAGKIIAWIVFLLAAVQWLPVAVKVTLLGVELDKGGYADIGPSHMLVLIACLSYLLGKKFVKSYHLVNGGKADDNPQAG